VGDPFSTLRLDVVDGIATLTLDRPDRLNAFTDAMETKLIAAFDRCDADDDVRVIVLTGAGRAFCAGMDLVDAGDAFVAWRGSATAPAGTQFDVPDDALPMRRDGGGRVVLRMYDSLKPIIAAVNGPAVGVGATMVLAADIRLASEAARFGFVFNRRGVLPESCSTWFLPRVVPMQVAMEWVFTGRVFPAGEAHEHGLVRSLHDPDDLMPAAHALAREIADHTAPVSAALSRQLMWRMLGAPHPMVAHTAETHALNLRGLSDDAREGFNSFLEKRPAVFPDRVSVDLPDVLTGLLTEPGFDPTTIRANLTTSRGKS
jgi:enoyl-CoA hydratase/carnithine racemase